MAALRCPKCQRIVIPRLKQKPHCPHCGAPVQRCRYCEHFEQTFLSCLHPETLALEERVIDPDELRSCDYFRYVPVRRKLQRVYFGLSSFVWQSIAALLVIAAMLYIGLTRYSGHTASMAALEFELTSTGAVMRDESFDIYFSVYNQSAQTARNVILTLTGESLRAANFLGLDPPPQEILQTGHGLSFSLGDFNPGASLTGRISLTPARIGRHKFKLYLTADNLSHPLAKERVILITE